MDPIVVQKFQRKYIVNKSVPNETVSSSLYKKTTCYNIVHKLFNREIYGSSTRHNNERNRKIFEQIPPRLRFCLMDIVPMSYLREHVFMGLSQCGQYLLSFTYSYNTQTYFRESSKFTLHFLLWVPGKVVEPVHSVPLFGDDSIDSKVTISMAQWKHNPGVIVVYGIADSCTERSYLSVIGVPKLGCKKCAVYAKEEDNLNWGQRCLEHNFAIHTKFFCTSDSSVYEPVVQLAYSNQIIIYTDFIHILEIDFVKPESERSDGPDEGKPAPDARPGTPSPDAGASRSPSHRSPAVQSILADFADCEAEPGAMPRPVQPDMLGQELCIAHALGDEREGARTLISPPLRSPRRRPAESMSRFNESHRLSAERAYEFVEEAEPRCEKLSLFRKRRLAERKYAFCENTENIVPFRVLRARRRAPRPPCQVVLRAHNQIPKPDEEEYRVQEPLADGSLKTVSVHDGACKTLSAAVHSGNSHCSKAFARYFLDCDDDASSLADSEDDCLSGYHVALHLSAHGACYLPLQAVGAAAWQRLCAAPAPPALTARARQRSLDTELLCNEVCGRLCELQGKKFIYCFDWGCHVIDACQSSGCLSGLCAMWLWASQEGGPGGDCEACKDVSAGCLVHRRQFAAECLFVWDLVTGLYRTERAAMTEDSSSEGTRVSGADRARELAKALGPLPGPPGNENRILTTLTGKSLRKLTDVDNCIEITKNHPDSSESESDTAEESDSD